MNPTETDHVEQAEDQRHEEAASSEGSSREEETVPADAAEGSADVALPESFEELGLGRGVLDAIEKMGFEHPSEVQAAAIPAALLGRDLLVQSRTGSGKTAAFVIPACDRLIDPGLRAPQVLVLAPTRELAQQVAREAARIAAGQPIETVAVYGGAAMGPQIDALRAGAQLVVATPGRLLDHLRRGNLDPSALRVLVLDECDEMLSMGFQEEINAILERLPAERQTLLFSATIPPEIERLAERQLRDPVRVYLSQDFVGVRAIKHVYYLVTGGARENDLLQILGFERPSAAIVFCNTREETGRVAEFLREAGVQAEAISSDLGQGERERVMARARSGDIRFLVATDVAARGIDISDLSHVINYTFPESADVYVHRTGRTGRAGKSGVAISLVSPREIGSFYYLKLIHRIFPEQRHLPSPQELATRREGEYFERLSARYAGRRPKGEMEGLARRIWSTPEGHRLLGLALEELLERLEDLPEQRSPVREGRAAPRARQDEATGSSGDGRRREGRGSRGDGPRGQGRPRRGERDTRRGESRRSSTRPAERQAEAIATADGEVEFFETIELSSAERATEDTPRAERGPSTTEAAEGMTRLYVNVGRRQRVPAAELAAFICAEGQVEASQVGRVAQRDRHSYVDVKSEVAQAVVERLAGKPFHDRPLRVELAKP